ncbi:hypothetical protein CWI37_0576p0010 [Hamiltosporidium tvaerminnensis]|uniref:Uncharacterized protein n=1 Tax=Hamiltosporidium tvaerminnensis TaxID=1176355 RepID=A0A4Q9L491_9MICR|nr:hypothetical protein CWI37_0576p0010 [Hamiltosporidium tvaerminnensis]
MRDIFLNLRSMINFLFALISSSDTDIPSYNEMRIPQVLYTSNRGNHYEYLTNEIMNKDTSCVPYRCNPQRSIRFGSNYCNATNEETLISTYESTSCASVPNVNHQDLNMANITTLALPIFEILELSAKTKTLISHFIQEKKNDQETSYIIRELIYTIFLLENFYSDSNRNLSINTSAISTSNFKHGLFYFQIYSEQYRFVESTTIIFDFHHLISNLIDEVRYLNSFHYNEEMISNISKYIESIENKEAEYIAMFPRNYDGFRNVWLTEIENILTDDDASILMQLFPEFNGLKAYILKNQNTVPNRNNYHVSSLLLLKYLFANKYILNIKNEFLAYKKNLDYNKYWLFKYLCDKKIIFEILHLFIRKTVSNLNAINISLIIYSTERIILFKNRKRMIYDVLNNINFIRSVIFLVDDNIIKDFHKIYYLILNNVLFYNNNCIRERTDYKMFEIEKLFNNENLLKILEYHLEIFYSNHSIFKKKYELSKSKYRNAFRMYKNLDNFDLIKQKIIKKNTLFQFDLKDGNYIFGVFKMILMVKSINDRLCSFISGDFQIYSLRNEMNRLKSYKLFVNKLL